MTAPERVEPFILLIGPPGCGKSTWARRYFHRNTIVGLDEMRGRVADDQGDQRATPYAVTAMHAIVEGRAQFGLTVVVDATNVEREHRDPLLGMAYRHGRSPVAVIFDVPVDVCLERNRRRRPTRRVPEKVVRRMHACVRREFPVERTWIAHGFSGTAWVIHNDGMRVGGGVVMDSVKHYGVADWLDGARLPAPDGWSGDGKWMQFRRAGWERRPELKATA